MILGSHLGSDATLFSPFAVEGARVSRSDQSVSSTHLTLSRLRHTATVPGTTPRTRRYSMSSGPKVSSAPSRMRRSSPSACAGTEISSVTTGTRHATQSRWLTFRSFFFCSPCQVQTSQSSRTFSRTSARSSATSPGSWRQTSLKCGACTRRCSTTGRRACRHQTTSPSSGQMTT